MTKTDYKKTTNGLKKRMADLKKAAKEAAKQFFKEESKALFDSNPDLQSFSWTGYTPYWMDGETPYFSAHTDYPTINGMNEEEIDDALPTPDLLCLKCNARYQPEEYVQDKGFVKNTHCKKCNVKLDNTAVKNFKKLHSAVCKFLRQFKDDDFEEMFGDHVKVTVTQKGVKIEEYTDHH